MPAFDQPEAQIEALRELQPDVVLTLLHLQAQHLPQHLPIVFTAEFDLGIRKEQIAALGIPPLHRVRANLGLLRRERVYRAMVKQARSVQCNGPAAARSYAGLTSNPLVFMDHRITFADVAAAYDIAPWDGSRPVRLAFSGRWTAIKGPQFAVRTASVLAERLPGCTLTMYGGGELESVLRAEAGENVTFEGFVDFESEWKPQVRQSVDLMLLPHVQGDPSCTYFEALGSGAPIVGFQNATLTPLIKQHAVGRVTREPTPQALADAVMDLVAEPATLTVAREAGLTLVASQTWEKVTEARVEHLLRAATSAR